MDLASPAVSGTSVYANGLIRGRTINKPRVKIIKISVIMTKHICVTSQNFCSMWNNVMLRTEMLVTESVIYRHVKHSGQTLKIA